MFVLHAHILGKYVRAGRTLFFFEECLRDSSLDCLRREWTRNVPPARPGPRRPAGTTTATESIRTRLSPGRFPRAAHPSAPASAAGAVSAPLRVSRGCLAIDFPSTACEALPPLLPDGGPPSCCRSG